MFGYARKVMTALRDGSFSERVDRHIAKGRRLYYVTDKDLRRRLNNDRVYRALKRQYRPVIENARPASTEAKPDTDEQAIPPIVWWCWLQGPDQAPELVQVCLESVRRAFPNYEIRIITEENWNEYVELPAYMLDRRARYGMSPNHFANLLRLALLLRYGGVWIDATVLVTGGVTLQQILSSAQLFMPSILFNREALRAENWLIGARPDDDILHLVWQLHEAYWKEHFFAQDRLFFYFFLTMAAEHYADQWRHMPIWCREPAQYLISQMRYPYSDALYEQAKRLSPFHKLNWRFQPESAPEGSFYDELIRRRRF